MKLMRSWVQPAVIGLLAATLAGSAASSAIAAEEPAYYYYVYTNPETNEAYFNVYLTGDDGSSEQKVISRTQDGTWHVLPEQVLQLGGDAMTPYVPAFARELSPPPFAQVYLDTAKDQLVAKTGYLNSPSGKFGVRAVTYYQAFEANQGYSKRVALFAKNNQNGVIRQIADSPAWPVTYWLPDGSLLMERYSETAKQNEIVRLNPDTLDTQRLLLASLLGYDEQKGQMLFAYNEPARQPHLYDIRTRQSRVVTGQEVNAFYDGLPSADRSNAPEVPVDLDIDTLPVKELGYRQDGEANLALNGAKISLPFVFFGLDRKLYIPMRPLSESQEWKVERREENGRGNYSYTVSTGHKSILVDRSNSKMLEDRLYVNADALRELDSGMGIEWVPVMP